MYTNEYFFSDIAEYMTHTAILHPYALLAIRAATEAGEELMKLYGTPIEQWEKEANDPLVTVADTTSHQKLITVLKTSNLPIISEEDPISQQQTYDRYWLLDPLDGTRDFIQQTDDFSIMIALVEDNTVTLGVVFHPPSHTIYLAEKGVGAYQHTGSDNSWNHLHLDTSPPSYIFTSRNHLSTKDSAILNALPQFSAMPMGSAGLKIVRIAAGVGSGYIATTNKMSLWDTAAASVILQEAGGCLSDIYGTPLSYNKKLLRHQHGVLASASNNIHRTLLSAIAATKDVT